MCLETMETSPKHTKPDSLRKTVRPGLKLRLRLIRVVAAEDEAFRRYRASAVRGPARKCPFRRERRRARLASKILGVMEEKERREESHPSGAMAPENTTQYLMSKVYEDMNIHIDPVSHEPSSHLYAESLSPSRVYSALDSCYETCLAFQQRDFEEVFNLC